VVSSRIIKEVEALGHEHRNLKRPFIFEKIDYVEKIFEQQSYFKDFIEHHLSHKVEQYLERPSGQIM
jgi:hypothetical protein